jgi:YD repeat-containing protein
MKNLLLFICFVLLSCTYTSAQTVDNQITYEYDAAGNRIVRKITEVTVTVKSEKLDPEPIEEIWGDLEITIYPNPTPGNLRVKIDGGEDDAVYTYIVYTSEGATVLTGEIIETGESIIAMAQFEPGVYLLVLKSKEDKHIFKIIKQ